MDEILQVIQDGATYLINGGLRVLYFAADHWPLLVGLLCTVIVAALFDRWVVALASATPARPGQPRLPRRATRRPYGITLLIFAVWLIAVSQWPQPVPALGAAMWVATVIVVLLLPAERAPLLSRCKNFIFSYAAVLLGGLWILNQTAAASPREWAAIIGGVGAAQDTLAQDRSLITTLITLLVMWWGPVAIFVYVGQRLQIHMGSLANPWQTAADILREIQTREGDSRSLFNS